MDKESLELFAAYCREHKITFAIHKRGDAFQIEFSADNDEDIKELLEYLKGRKDDKTA